MNNYRNYNEGCREAADAYKNVMKEANDNYKGTILESKLEALKLAHRNTIAALEAEFITPIRDAFTAAKMAVRAASVRPIPAHLRESLAGFECLKISDGEKNMILEMTKNSHLARKRAIELLNVTEDELPPSIDTVLSDIEALEKVLYGSTRKPVDSYDARIIAHGDWLNKVQDEVTAFCEAYGE